MFLYHVNHCFPGGSDGKRTHLQCRRPRFDPWVGKIPWRRKLQPTQVLLPGESHGLRSLLGYSKLDTTERQTLVLSSKLKRQLFSAVRPAWAGEAGEHLEDMQGPGSAIPSVLCCFRCLCWSWLYLQLNLLKEERTIVLGEQDVLC